MIDRFVQQITTELQARADTKAKGILRGDVPPEAYKGAVEHYQALMSTIALIKELARKFDD